MNQHIIKIQAQEEKTFQSKKEQTSQMVREELIKRREEESDKLKGRLKDKKLETENHIKKIIGSGKKDIAMEMVMKAFNNN